MLTLPESYFDYLEKTLGVDLRSDSFQGIKPFLPHIGFLSEQLSKNRLRETFTGKPYLNQAELLRAYQLYYTTVNLLKVHLPLDEVAGSGFFQNKERIDILDVGSGTGTMILGFMTWLEKKKFPSVPSLLVTALDHSSAALNALKMSLKYYGQLGIETAIRDLNKPFSDGRTYDIIFAGNVLNEIFPESQTNFLNSLTGSLRPDGYLINIEPALKDTSRGLLAFRNRWMENGGFVYSPCLTRKPCPALVHHDDWCHHDVPWNRPSFIEYIDESIGLIKKSLKFTYMIFTPSDVHFLDHVGEGRDFRNVFRVVSELFNEKGRCRAYLCNDHGRLMFEKNKRDDTSANRCFSLLNRYDLIRVDQWKKKNDIGKILPESAVRLNDG